MTQPTIVEIPHNLSRDEVRRRMSSRVRDLPQHIPGGMATVTSSWPAQDRMIVTVCVLGQEVPCTLDVEDAVVRASIQLPGMVSLMAGPIASIVRQRGEDLLLDDDVKRPA
ncbi:hypothetical protein BH10PSE12_BH10PSE12_05430 [soil metagenome]